MQERTHRMDIGRDTRTESDVNGRRKAHSTVVNFTPCQCPECGSARSKIIDSRRIVPTVIQRYHQCLNCPTLFKSEQELRNVDMTGDPTE